MHHISKPAFVHRICANLQAANINLIAALNQEQQESESKLTALRQQHDRLQAELQSQVACIAMAMHNPRSQYTDAVTVPAASMACLSEASFQGVRALFCKHQ